MRWVTAARLCSLCVLVAPSTHVRAADAEPVRVGYQAPSNCPAQPAFEAIFLRELGRATLAQASEYARALAIRVTESAQGFQAGVELVDREGRSVARAIEAPTCEQAVEAIALVAALAARSQAEPSDEADASLAPAASPMATPSAEPSPIEPPPPPRAIPADSGSAPARATPPVAPGAARESTRLFGAAAAGLLFATGVGPAPAFGAVVELRLGMTGPAARSLALLASYADTFRTSVNGVDVRMRLVRARLELCPFEPSFSQHVSVSPCAGFELGSQSGSAFEDGTRVFNTQAESRLWAAGTLAGRARFRWGDVGAALGPEVVFPFTRNEFLLARPEIQLYEVPRVAFAASAVAGIVW
ncbi:MAG TPA: hypothetical protein VFV94_18800 [Polyangiaceae bacterium]|nr:hypothetical protein [Polyangiaceae bacterium]